MSDDTRYPCCQHCRDFGRRVGWFGPVDDDHENHVASCYTTGCPGSVPVGPTKEGE